MPSKTSKKKPAAVLPSIPKELIDQMVSGPMDAEAVNAASMAFKKALIERALGAELGQDAPVLAQLGGLQALIGAGEDGGRVGHRRVEPQAIEIVAQVVVGLDVAPGAAAGVGPQHVRDAVADQAQHPPVDRVGQHRAVLRQQGE